MQILSHEQRPLTTTEETLGEHLARLRKARGLAQAELGELVGRPSGCSRTTSAAADAPAHLLPHLADALQVSVSEPGRPSR
jgi:transcriptional regulator with XRE-family HTH domain